MLIHALANLALCKCAAMVKTGTVPSASALALGRVARDRHIAQTECMIGPRARALHPV